MLVTSVVAAHAETVYVYNGYSYTLMENPYISICGWDNSSESFTVPAQLDGSFVKEIGDRALRNNEAVTSLDFSGAIYLTRIGNLAFKGCKNVSGTVSVPARVTDVGISAFQECTGMEQFNFYAGSATVPMQCCYLCTSLKNVVISDQVTAIEKLAFASCDSLESVRLPRSVTSIDSSAFQDDPNLTLGVYFGSYAHQYAKDNSIPYVFLDDYVLGDVNLDGVVDVTDVTYVQQYAADLTEFNELQLSLADLTGDDIIDISDATKIQRIAADME